MKNSAFVLVTALLFSIPALAADGGAVAVPPSPMPGAAKKPVPKVFQQDSQIFVDFQDGRIARFQQAIGHVKRAGVGMIQTENTCDQNQVLASCNLNLDIASMGIYLRWVKNPDASKLGKTVVVKKGNNKEDKPLSNEDRTLFWFDTWTMTEWKSFFKPDQIVCDNLKWIKDMPATNDSVTVQSWIGEFMFQNLETGMNENQGISNAFNVVLKKVNDKTLEIAQTGPYQRLSVFPPYLALQTATLVFEDKFQKQCQLSFQVDIQKIGGDFQTPEFKKIDLTTERPLTTPSPLDGSELKSDLINVIQNIRNGSNVEVE
jgi:hypothetical protein